MPFLSKAAIDKFDAAIHSAPNELTQVLRGHRAIEVEIHNTLGLRLSLSSRLDLHKIPFLTKVDLLISLDALKAAIFPLFGEVNRIRNRFAHNPDASTTEEDLIRFRNIHSSSLGSEIAPSLEINTPSHGMRYLLLLVYTAARSSYELGVNERVQTRAINEWILEQNTGKEHIFKDEEFRRIRREADETLATAAKALLKVEHPDVDFHYLHRAKSDEEISTKKD